LRFDSPSSKEEDKLNPSSPYSASKAGAEMLCLANLRTFSQPIIITRSSNNFGPFQFPEKVIPLFVTNIIEGRKVPLYGSGKNIRDWIYVIDNCAAIDFAIRRGEVGQIYNIGGGNELSNLDLSKRILSQLGKDETWIEHVADRKGHDLRYSLCCTKIQELGWKPKFILSKTSKQIFKYYKGTLT